MKTILLQLKNQPKKEAIVEIDTDGAHVMNEAPVEESNRVKMFDKFIPDLRELLKRFPGSKQKLA